MEQVPIHAFAFIARSSFATLAQLVKEGYARIDKDIMVQFPEDDDE